MGWVFREFDHYYAPGIYWPQQPPPPEGDTDVDAYMALFRSRGYVECDNPDMEDGYIKIAIYEKDGTFHHVAKQLPSGAWSSKVGQAHDVRHERLDALEGSPVFFDNATATRFMKRRYDPQAESFEFEETGLL